MLKRKISIKRIIIILCIALVYSVAICFISILAKDSILNDIAFSENSASALSNNVNSEVQPGAASELPKNEPRQLEHIVSKAQIDEYDIFTPVVTQITDIAKDTKDSEEMTEAPQSPSYQPSSESITSSEAPKKPETAAPETETVTPPTTTTETEKKPETKKSESQQVPVTDEQIEIDPDGEDVEINDEQVDIDDTNYDPDVQLSEYDAVPNPWDMPSSYWGAGNPTAGQYFDDVLQNGKSYRDDIVTIYDKTSGRYVTDNAFDIVCKVTFNEVGTSMHPEAIKAQAVAVYTYIKYYQAKGEYASLSTKNDVPQTVIDCVSAVDGLAMYYDGEYIMSCFSAATGGVTCSSENVWGGKRPYLVSVRNDYDYLDTKNYGRVTTYTADEVKKRIESKTDIKLSDNCENWIRILSYNDGGYVGQLSIDGYTSAEVSGRTRDLTAYVFRTYILSIRSTCFTVSYSNGIFTFVTYGYGHGVGMAQEGADLYATYGGYSFDQILHHYYTGITIK